MYKNLGDLNSENIKPRSEYASILMFWKLLGLSGNKSKMNVDSIGKKSSVKELIILTTKVEHKILRVSRLFTN